MFKQIRFPYTSKRRRHRSVVTVLGRCMCHKHFAPMAKGYITQPSCLSQPIREQRKHMHLLTSGSQFHRIWYSHPTSSYCCGCDYVDLCFHILRGPSRSVMGITITFLKKVTIPKYSMGGSPGELSEELVMQEKRRKCWRMSCDVGEVTESLENEQVKQQKGWRMSCNVGEVTESLENQQVK